MSRKNWLPVIGVRKVTSDDIVAVEDLVSNTTREYFGDFNLPQLIERSYLALGAHIENNKLVGVIIFQNFPNIPAIPDWDWKPWIDTLYNLDQITPRNFLFINFMAWNSKYKSEFLTPILTRTFYDFYFLLYVILISPPQVVPLFFIEEAFTRILPEGYWNYKRVQTLNITVRQRYVTRFKIRRAVEEDNDDIVPLIDQHATRLREIYGDFYVSEIIQSAEDPKILCSKNRQFIVAEFNELAIGVLCLTTQVDYNVLNNCFELACFHGLKKPHKDDVKIITTLEDDKDEIAEIYHISRRSVHKSISHLSEADSSEHLTTTHHISDIATNTEVHGEASISTDHTHSDSADSIIILDEVPSYHTGWSQSTASHLPMARASSLTFSVRILGGSGQKATESVSKSSTSTIEQASIPEYFGADNAFAIELFAAETDKERAAASDLIEAAFECYPDLDYCIMTVPSTYPPWPLRHTFVRVPPRPRTTYPHELYVLHRNARLSDVAVREARDCDITKVKTFFGDIRNQEQIMENFESSLTDPGDPYTSYVMTTEKNIVGVVVLTEEDDYDYLSSHYILNEYIDLQHYPIGSFGKLVNAVVSPIFQTHKRYFLREVHRLSDLPVIHFCLYPSDCTERPLANIVAEMIAIAPRLRPEYHPNLAKDGDVPRDFVLRQDPAYALYLMNIRHSSIPKEDVNRKLVVVGASSTGMSFLENMAFGTTASIISFTNMTLVSPHGYDHMKVPSRARDMLFPFEGRYNYSLMRQVTIQSYVNLVSGAMTAINRRDKYIIVDDSTIIPYDYLFLTCGEQHQPPENISEYPENVFIVNTEIDGATALDCLRVQIANQKHYTVIVYGATLEAFCCLAALREFGVPGANIKFVEPYPDPFDTENVSLFNCNDIDEAMETAIHKEGIERYSAYYFQSWEYSPYDRIIKSVKFEGKFRTLQIPCTAMFFYDKKRVSKKTLSAINRAGLVYDSRLVIDPLYRTNDPLIFSAGSMTKYSRRYYADHLEQKYFNRVEVGARLAMYTKQNLDPSYVKQQETEAEIYMRKVLTPLFSLPNIKYCSLPGGFNYLYITKPGKPVSITAQMCREDYGRVLVTGDLTFENQGYFRIHLNANNKIETIICLNKEPIDVQNMIKLWGQHERLLNNLVQRYDMVLIKDFYEYFRQPWVYAIFHESFEEKVQTMNQMILRGKTQTDDSILQKIKDELGESNYQKLTPKQRKEIEDLYKDSEHKKEIEENLLDFLLVYDMHLPVYAHPLKTKLLLAGYENSPLHFPQ